MVVEDRESLFSSSFWYRTPSLLNSGKSLKVETEGGSIEMELNATPKSLTLIVNLFVQMIHCGQEVQVTTQIQMPQKHYPRSENLWTTETMPKLLLLPSNYPANPPPYASSFTFLIDAQTFLPFIT